MGGIVREKRFRAINHAILRIQKLILVCWHIFLLKRARLS